jgi:site-specific recombinase XerD
MEWGSKEYRRSLKLAFHHQVIEMSSESTCESSSTDEEELRSYKEMRKAEKRKETKKKVKEVKNVKHESIFKKVYSSDDEDESDNEYHPLYPSIFRGICAEREHSDELLNAEESLKGDGLAERDESPPRGESSDSPGRKELPGREELPRRKEVPGKKELPVRKELSGRKELPGRKEMPGRKVVPERDEVMSEEWSSEEQESIDQSLSDGNYTDDSEVESIHLSLPLNTLRDEQHIFEQFEKWLPTADGGRKDEGNAQQCCRQIKLVTQYICPEKPTLKDVLDRQTLRDQWLNKFEKEKRPGTAKSYLGALRQFYSFLQCESPKSVDASPKVLSALMVPMMQWSKSYHRLVKARFLEKRMDDLEKLHTPEQIQKFNSSTVARAAVKTLGEYEEKPDETMPSQTEYTSVRDYLLTSICISNGSRSGALANMTIGEFRSAQALDGSFVVKVKKHKTFTTHGPANIVLSTMLHNWMKIFINKFCYALADNTSENGEPVFLTWSNRPMDSSQIGCQIDSAWGKVFGKYAATGGATAFRKAAVSAVNRSDKSRREDLAGLMVHNKATADLF